MPFAVKNAPQVVYIPVSPLPPKTVWLLLANGVLLEKSSATCRVVRLDGNQLAMSGLTIMTTLSTPTAQSCKVGSEAHSEPTPLDGAFDISPMSACAPLYCGIAVPLPCALNVKRLFALLQNPCSRLGVPVGVKSHSACCSSGLFLNSHWINCA